MNETFDFMHPSYGEVIKKRAERIEWIRATHKKEKAAKAIHTLPMLKAFYKNNPAHFINDFGTTYDPRNPERDLPAHIPFLLFKRQEDWINWVIDHWKNSNPGITEKSRESGMSWLAISVACWFCIFYDGVSIGFGSKKQEDVDLNGSMDSLFEKARMFMENLPVEFRAGWTRDTSPFMRMGFPESKSFMIGKSGDGIGRGGRYTIFFVDESAFLERPQLIDRSLSEATRCRIDISTPNGPANPFAQKRFEYPPENVFRFHWLDDPRKDQAWYDKKVRELDPVTLAQEVNIDYNASVEGVLIPSSWVQAAIDSHLKLGISNSGTREAALDVADGGKDKCALAGSYGFLLDVLHEWQGKDSDIFATVQKAFSYCDVNDYGTLRYDADGLGAGVRGDARIINENRNPRIEVVAFQGSSAVLHPERQDVKGRKNRDFFANLKAQAWWSLRTRFEKTFLAVVKGEKIDPDDLISLSSKLPNLLKLVQELSQPTYQTNGVGKIVIDKAPDDAPSPNLADAVMIRYAPIQLPLKITSGTVRRFSSPVPSNPVGVTSAVIRRFSGNQQSSSAVLNRFKR